MEFRIADTFTDSLARLTGEEQKAVKTTAFDLQLNPASPGMSLHKLAKARDKRFWSARVSGDIRLILHRDESSLLLCYVDHHDKAYEWAERRKLETHPTTGAAQLVEIRETVKEIVVPAYVQETVKATPRGEAVAQPALFAALSDDQLLGYGVPAEWLPDVKSASAETLLALADHLPAEAAEALLELATGGTPRVAKPETPVADPFAHPDAQRRFRVMTNVEELKRALDYPWEKWTVFLHPEQRQLVEREWSGPARVSGSAGTGKTIVALHRAVHLARAHPEARVLLTTFSETLASSLRTKLRRLLGNEPRLGERIDVHSLDAIGTRLHSKHVGPVTLATRDQVRAEIIRAASSVDGHRFSPAFLVAEWDQVVDAWQIGDWPGYRDVARLGRRTRLPESQRAILWSIFERVRSSLASQKLVTSAALFTTLAESLAGTGSRPFDFVVADEAQDLSVAHLRFLAALGGGRPSALFFAGDIGQRIFQQPFSWKSLGVDIRGRSRTLRVNYRTSHQIRAQADRLLGPVVTDIDGVADRRDDTVSVFNGPPPDMFVGRNEDEEIERAAEWLTRGVSEGLLPHEIGVFVRSDAQLERARRAVDRAELPFRVLDEHVEVQSGRASVCTMHLAKGLEFRAVVVMACEDEVIPLQERIEAVGDDADLQEVYDTERHLLYVACTRARDRLFVSGVDPVSEFLDDMRD
jgi:mRNA-degrading endonuclease RelE of RelBE toxin-antitoxin system